MGADPEAREPWLATEFEPGPSLAEAVAAHGPLPAHTLRALAARLADALAAVHRAGLVHRDVKPGNVLLSVAGPRLIDFGIARATGATALTATDVVIGSPGYLSPEQARAAGAAAVGPPSDVFSLGCVLAFAATARRPFGTGSAAAVVYRTVHGEPDLDGVPGPLLALVRACLAKDPGARPTAEEIRERMGPGAPGGDWLPAGLPALIARRSARVLDLPVPEPTEVSPPPAPPADPGEPTVPAAPAPPGPTPRRRLLVLGSAGAVAAATGAGVWLARRGFGGAPAAGPSGPLPRHVIAVQTDLSGPRRADGRAQERGARLAVAAHNARPGRGFDLALTVRDDAGDPRRAGAEARSVVADRSVVAVLGVTSAPVVRSVVKAYETALMPLLSVLVGEGGGGSFGIPGTPGKPRSYVELRPPDTMLMMPVSRYLTARRVRRTAVLEDRAGDRLTWDIVKTLREAPPAEGSTSVHRVEAGATGFAAAVRAALATRPDAVVYAGSSPRRAALAARALRDQGHTGLRGAVEPVLQPEFLSAAGPAAEGWLFGTSYVDPARVASARGFVAAYRERWGGTAVPRYAAEAYDAVLCVAQAIRELGPDRAERGAVSRRLVTLTHRGVAKTLSFSDTTQTLNADPGMFTYRIKDGRPRFLGHYERAAR
ncbi:bifunctional serine/threonine-protein kinase/ABC transporter substrate-binding protein [Streptomyces sp. PmtG]